MEQEAGLKGKTLGAETRGRIKNEHTKPATWVTLGGQLSPSGMVQGTVALSEMLDVFTKKIFFKDYLTRDM